MIESRNFLTFIGPAPMMLYVGYCWVNQGFYQKVRRWKTREESPRGFWFTIVLWLVLSVAAIASSLILKR